VATNVNKKIVDIPMVGDPGPTEIGRAEGATSLHKNWKVVSGALISAGRIYNEYEYDYRSSFQSCNNDHRWVEPAEFFTRNSLSSSDSALESMVCMTGYRDAYKLDIPMQWPMAMVMLMMSSERKQFRMRYRYTANMATEAVPNVIPNDCDMATEMVLKEMENDNQAYRIVYQMASQETVEITTKR